MIQCFALSSIIFRKLLLNIKCQEKYTPPAGAHDKSAHYFPNPSSMYSYRFQSINFYLFSNISQELFMRIYNLRPFWNLLVRRKFILFLAKIKISLCFIFSDKIFMLLEFLWRFLSFSLQIRFNFYRSREHSSRHEIKEVSTSARLNCQIQKTNIMQRKITFFSSQTVDWCINKKMHSFFLSTTKNFRICFSWFLIAPGNENGSLVRMAPSNLSAGMKFIPWPCRNPILLFPSDFFNVPCGEPLGIA